jgi:hypothetical protein
MLTPPEMLKGVDGQFNDALALADGTIAAIGEKGSLALFEGLPAPQDLARATIDGSAGGVDYGTITTLGGASFRWFSFQPPEWVANGLSPAISTGLGSRLFVCGQVADHPNVVETGTMSHALFEPWPPTGTRIHWTHSLTDSCRSFSRVPGRTDRIRLTGFDQWTDFDTSGQVVDHQFNIGAQLGLMEPLARIFTSSNTVAIQPSDTGSAFRSEHGGRFSAVYGGRGDRSALYASVESGGLAWLFGGTTHAIAVDPTASTSSAAREMALSPLPGDVTSALSIDEAILLSGRAENYRGWVGRFVPTSTRVEMLIDLGSDIGALIGFGQLTRTHFAAVSESGRLVFLDLAQRTARALPADGPHASCRALSRILPPWGGFFDVWRSIDGRNGVVWVGGCDQRVLRFTATTTSAEVLTSPQPLTPTVQTVHALCPDHVILTLVHESGSSPPLLLELRNTAGGFDTTRSLPLVTNPEALVGDERSAAIVFDDRLEALGDQAPIRLPLSTGRTGSAFTAVRLSSGVIVVGGPGGRVALVR